jgi:hypothetical protein
MVDSFVSCTKNTPDKQKPHLVCLECLSNYFAVANEEVNFQSMNKQGNLKCPCDTKCTGIIEMYDIASKLPREYFDAYFLVKQNNIMKLQKKHQMQNPLQKILAIVEKNHQVEKIMQECDKENDNENDEKAKVDALYLAITTHICNICCPACGVAFSLDHAAYCLKVFCEDPDHKTGCGAQFCGW